MFKKWAEKSCTFRRHLQFYWPLLLVFVSIPIAFKFEHSLTPAMLAATLVAVTWYSVETRRLRIAQEHDAEIRNHPWITVEKVEFRLDKDGGGFVGSEHIMVSISNKGLTPANEILISGESPTDAASHENQIRFMDNSIGNLPPGVTRETEVAVVNLEKPGERTQVDFHVAYKSCKGGGGRIRVSCILSEEQGHYGWRWHLAEPYEFWLSTGKKFSA